MAANELIWQEKLIKTKYSRPGSGRYHIVREAVEKKLNQIVDYNVTIVSAPAGYGKSTAVLEWIKNSGICVAWVSLDNYDNDPSILWRYVCAALDSITDKPGMSISRDTSYVFRSQELLNSKIHLGILIERLSELDFDYVLVLDDFHYITEPRILDNIRYIISYLPEKMHLVLISRTIPELQLEKQGLRCRLHIIEPQNLRFKTEEIESFFRARGIALRSKELQIIEDYTEGWAAALVAVALSLDNTDVRSKLISSLNGCNIHMNRYLEEDVFNTWSESEQEFLLRTSVVDRMSGSLCEALTDEAGSRLLLELYRHNSFLSSLDEDGIWFRYHQIFQNFLRKKLTEDRPGLEKVLCKKAGAWFHENGYNNESVEYYIRGACYEEALGIIEEQAGPAARSGAFGELVSRIDRLPEEYILKSQLAMMIKALCCTELREFKKAWEWIDRVGELAGSKAPMLEERGKRFRRTPFLMIKSSLYKQQGDTDNMAECIIRAAENGIEAGMTMNFVDFNQYEVSSYRCSQFCAIKLLRKDPERYRKVNDCYRTLIDMSPGYDNLAQGEYLYETNLLEAAVPKLAAAIDEAIEAKCAGVLVPAMITMAKLKRAEGDLGGALDTIRECESMIAFCNKPHWRLLLNAFRIYLNIDSGEMKATEKWMNSSRLGVYHEITRPREYEMIVFSRALMKENRLEDANILLNRLLSHALHMERFHSAVEILNLLALNVFKRALNSAAMEYLERSLMLGLEYGLKRSFIDELAPMQILLEDYLVSCDNNGPLWVYADELLDQTREAVGRICKRRDKPNVERLLTAQERKVLQLIVNAYNNNEIAEELCITLRTVKAHTTNIYHKLGVKSRSECIKKVREI